MTEIQYYRDNNLPIFELKTCKTGIHSSKMHAHMEVSIGIVEEGASTVLCQGRTFKVTAANAIIIPSAVIHKCNPENVDKWKFKMAYLDTNWIKNVFGVEFFNYAVIIKKLNYIDFNKAKSLIELLKSDCNAIEKETSLIVELGDLFKVQDYIKEPISLDSNNIRAVIRIKKYINKNFLKELELKELAEHCGLSKYYVIKLFKQAFDTTPHAYQMSLRLNYAKEELKKGKDVSEVAVFLGFYDQSHFTKYFKQYFGVTPLRYSLKL
jgi:AraC-like DNA-binding protein